MDRPSVGTWIQVGESSFDFCLEGEPISQNAAYKRRMLRTKGGAVIPGKGLYMTTEGKGFKEAINARAAFARPDWWEQDGPMGVKLELHFGSRRPDINNSTKLILDALEGAVYVNDRQVQTLLQHKFLDKERPRLEVTVWRIP